MHQVVDIRIMLLKIFEAAKKPGLTIPFCHYNNHGNQIITLSIISINREPYDFNLYANGY